MRKVSCFLVAMVLLMTCFSFAAFAYNSTDDESPVGLSYFKIDGQSGDWNEKSNWSLNVVPYYGGGGRYNDGAVGWWASICNDKLAVISSDVGMITNLSLGFNDDSNAFLTMKDNAKLQVLRQDPADWNYIGGGNKTAVLQMFDASDLTVAGVLAIAHCSNYANTKAYIDIGPDATLRVARNEWQDCLPKDPAEDGWRSGHLVYGQGSSVMYVEGKVEIAGGIWYRPGATSATHKVYIIGNGEFKVNQDFYTAEQAQADIDSGLFAGAGSKLTVTAETGTNLRGGWFNGPDTHFENVDVTYTVIKAEDPATNNNAITRDYTGLIGHASTALPALANGNAANPAPAPNPKTGDTDTIIVYLILMLLSGGLMFVLARKAVVRKN